MLRRVSPGRGALWRKKKIKTAGGEKLLFATLATVIEKLAMGATEGAQVSRFQSQDGQIRLMETHLHLVIDPSSGKPEALRATAHDITERKAAEQRVADERRELPGLAFQDGLT